MTTSMPTALPTDYAGITFRSRLEARWAMFFDALVIAWQYEPEGFELNGGSYYLPDFLLPDQHLYVEVKGSAHDRAGIGRWLSFAESLEGTGLRAALFMGDIPDPARIGPGGLAATPDILAPGIITSWDRDYAWCRCPCGASYDVQWEGRGGRISWCGCGGGSGGNHNSGDDPTILAAYRQARQAFRGYGFRGRQPIEPSTRSS